MAWSDGLQAIVRVPAGAVAPRRSRAGMAVLMACRSASLSWASSSARRAPRAARRRFIAARPAEVIMTSTTRPSCGSAWRRANPVRSSRETSWVIAGWVTPSRPASSVSRRAAADLEPVQRRGGGEAQIVDRRARRRSRRPLEGRRAAPLSGPAPFARRRGSSTDCSGISPLIEACYVIRRPPYLPPDDLRPLPIDWPPAPDRAAGPRSGSGIATGAYGLSFGAVSVAGRAHR